MSDSDVLVFLRWFYTAFFALFGVFQILRGRNFLSARTADCFLKVPASDTSGTLQRVEAAVERRQAAEGTPVPLGLWMGSFSFVLAAVAATGLIKPGLLYAAMCLGMTLGVAAVFLRLRNSQPTRVAVLSARSVHAVIPSYWFFAAAFSALTVLSYAAIPQYRIASVLVTVSSLLSVALAWRLAGLPALLTGVDITAEQFVDDRLRFYRSRAAMVFGVCETFVFCALVTGDRNMLQLLSYALTAAVCIAFAVWMLKRQFSMVQLA